MHRPLAEEMLHLDDLWTPGVQWSRGASGRGTPAGSSGEAELASEWACHELVAQQGVRNLHQLCNHTKRPGQRR